MTNETAMTFTTNEENYESIAQLKLNIAALRQEIEGLRLTVSELTTIALGDEKFDKWFDTRFGDSLTTLVEDQVRETIEDIVDDDYIEKRIDLGNYNLNDYIDTDDIAREVIESDKIQDKIEEVVNDAIDNIEVQITR